MIRAVCDQGGQPLEPGVFPCKIKSLDVRPDGTVVLVLEAACLRCGGPFKVEGVLRCYEMEVK